MANSADANTANFDRWGRPAWAGRRSDNFDSRDFAWHPGRIIVTIAAFIIWWPLGLAILAYSLWSRNMGCWSNDRHGRWANKMERMQDRMERMRGRMEGRGYYAPSSGNRAFDDYRMETLRRLEEEQGEFKNFLDRLRHAKDKEEFDAFMAQHRQRPTPPSDQPQG
jgi:hypothetical protein